MYGLGMKRAETTELGFRGKQSREKVPESLGLRARRAGSRDQRTWV